MSIAPTHLLECSVRDLEIQPVRALGGGVDGHERRRHEYLAELVSVVESAILVAGARVDSFEEGGDLCIQIRVAGGTTRVDAGRFGDHGTNVSESIHSWSLGLSLRCVVLGGTPQEERSRRQSSVDMVRCSLWARLLLS